VSAPLDRAAIVGVVTEGDGVWDLDLRTGDFRVDERSWRLLGYDPSAPALPPWPSLVHPDDQPIVLGAGNECLQRSVPLAYTIRLRDAEGRFVRMSVRGNVAARADDGSPLRLAGTHGLAPEGGTLDAGDGRPLDTLLAALPELLLVLGPDATLVAAHCGDAGVRAAVGALIGQPFAPRVAERPGAEQVRARVQAALATGEVQLLDVQWAPDGRPHRFEVRLARITGASVLALLHDVTERVEAQDMLQRVAAAMPGGIYLYTRWPDGRDQFLYLSEGTERLLGLPAREVLSDSSRVWTVVHPDDRAGLVAALERSMQTGATLLHEFRATDGPRIRWIRAHASPSTPSADGAVSWAGVALDVTAARDADAERRRLEERAARGERLERLGLLAGGIAHDFNNLLVGVFGAAAALREELADGHPARALATQIERAARDMGDLTRQMLDFSGRSPAPPRRVDLSDAVRDSLALVRASLGAGPRLELALSPEPAPVEIDPSQVTQLVSNLAINAAQAMAGREGTIRIATSVGEPAPEELRDGAFGVVLAPGRYAQLVVRDDGPGMTDEVRERIFEPFFSSKGSGRGLGLAVVAGIVRGRGGAVRVESAPARGTTFRILLPLAAPLDGEASGGAGRAAQPEELRPGTTVLVVDDEPNVRSVARRVLERIGCRVLLAEGGEEALRLVESGAQVSVAIVDATMPGLSGAETLRRLRALRPALPLVLTSGHAEDEARRAASEAVAGFLPKPFLPDDLRGAIERALAGLSD